MKESELQELERWIRREMQTDVRAAKNSVPWLLLRAVAKCEQVQNLHGLSYALSGWHYNF